uniref:Uncharacterized protein n=1 Tax=Glossina austeni TaxID=7395 RepID=A0A1A9VEP3_GLOAU
MILDAAIAAAIDDKNDKHLLNGPISEISDLDYNDIEKEDTYNVSEASVSSNQCKTGISENYHWDEDDNDLFLSISTQEIVDQNDSPNISRFPANKQITQGNQRNNKNFMLRENNVGFGLHKASGEQPKLGEGKNAVGANEIFIETDLEELENKIKCKFFVNISSYASHLPLEIRRVPKFYNKAI